MTDARKPPVVPCPTCKGPSRFAPDNPWRPFCSQRCRAIDLGAWASEGYRVAGTAPTDDPDTDDSETARH
jgi:endogenous inhibitor of DNA gyrase (YacG/DUF329 family)